MLPPLRPPSLVGQRPPPALPLPSLQSLHAATSLASLAPLPPVVGVLAFPPALRHHSALPLPLPRPTQRLRPVPKYHDDDNNEAPVDDGSHSPDTVDKRARRKEQCRVNQANYRKRKRQHELQLTGAIQTLEREVTTLTTRLHALTDRTQLQRRRAYSGHALVDDNEPEHAIASFYLAMQAPSRDDSLALQTLDAGVATSLLALQSEQFHSLDEMERVWRQHQRWFACFRLHVVATERLEAGDHVVIKVAAELEVVGVDKKYQEPIVCPVAQRFEIDSATQRVSHVTSEVDLIAGAMATAARRSPRVLAQVLDELRMLHS